MPTASRWYPDGIHTVCVAHISILRLFILQSGQCVTSAAFVYQAAIWGHFGCMAFIRLAPFYQGGQMLAVHGRKTVCALKFSCVQNEGWGGQMLGPQNCTTVAALSCAIWERKARTMPTLKSRDCTGPACISRFFGAGSISLVLQGDMSKRLHLHEP